MAARLIPGNKNKRGVSSSENRRMADMTTMPEKMQRKLFDIFRSRIEVFFDRFKGDPHPERWHGNLKSAWEEYLSSLGLERRESSVVGEPPTPKNGEEDFVMIRCPLLNIDVRDRSRSWLVIPQDLAFKILSLGSLP